MPHSFNFSTTCIEETPIPVSINNPEELFLKTAIFPKFLINARLLDTSYNSTLNPSSMLT